MIQHTKCEHTAPSDSEVTVNHKDAFCQSPFSAVFRHACEDAKEMIDEQSSEQPSDDNPYYCPGIVKIRLDNYMPIFPLWSGIMLGDLTQPAIDVNEKNPSGQEDVNEECLDQKDLQEQEDFDDDWTNQKGEEEKWISQ